jgi:hypothetical protein
MIDELNSFNNVDNYFEPFNINARITCFSPPIPVYYKVSNLAAVAVEAIGCIVK